MQHCKLWNKGGAINDEDIYLLQSPGKTGNFLEESKSEEVSFAAAKAIYIRLCRNLASPALHLTYLALKKKITRKQILMQFGDSITDPLNHSGKGLGVKLEGAMTTPLSPSVQKVQDAIRTLGFSIEVVELEATTRTSADAAQAVGCKVEQIAKSLVFQTKVTHRPILVIASGSNRVNEKRMAEVISESLGRRMPILSACIPVLPLAGSRRWVILRSLKFSSMKIC